MPNSPKNTEPMIQGRLWGEVVVEGLFKRSPAFYVLCPSLFREVRWPKIFTIFGIKYVSIEMGTYS